MSAIGFRSFPNGFAYVVLDGTQHHSSLIARQRLKFPRNHTPGAALSWLRKQTIEILDQYRPDSASIKCAEPMAKRKSIGRCQVDGVITEATFSALGVECTARINSQLKRDIRDFTKPARYLSSVLNGTSDLIGLNTPNFREAALAAIAELRPQ